MALPKAVRHLYDQASPAHRKTMFELRTRILQVVPKAEEVVSYGMPAFKVQGNIVAGIMAAKNHVGYYPFSGSVLSLFPNELAKYKTTKSAIHVPIGEPLSKALISKLIRARISQCPIKRGNIDLLKYERKDLYWKGLGIAAPARRGLVDNKLLTLSDLKRITKQDFLKIHGMGPRATAVITKEMAKSAITFKK